MEPIHDLEIGTTMTPKLNKLKCLIANVKASHKTVNELKAKIYLIQEDISKQKESVQWKHQGFINLATWLVRCLERHDKYISYFNQIEPIEQTAASAVLTLVKFDVKLKEATQQLTDMVVANVDHLNEMFAMEFSKVAFETLEAHVAIVEQNVPTATAIYETFVALKAEWIELKKEFDSDLDDCIDKVNALIQEVYIMHGVGGTVQYRIAVGDTSKSYIQLIIWWINLNRMVPLNSYAPQALAIRNKFTETYMRFSAFQLKFSTGIRKVKEINELCPHLFEAMKTLRNIEQLSSEEVEDVNRQLQVGISKVMEEAAISVVLLVEWFAMNQGIFSDLDDCVEGMKALIEQGLQEITARRKTRLL
ncbi:unnamed protein product [Orchesella dallaii]|uniref:Uncharacterized protein n=1 Tax=Orchesella dallaii TaxID=48710 RepID=A0ABP1QTB8_9HEXA